MTVADVVAILDLTAVVEVLRPKQIARKRRAESVERTSIAVSRATHTQLSTWAAELGMPLAQVVEELCALAQRTSAAKTKRSEVARRAQATRRAREQAAGAADKVEYDPTTNVTTEEQETVVNAS